MRLVSPGFVVVHIIALHAAALWFRHAGSDAPLGAPPAAPAPSGPAGNGAEPPLPGAAPTIEPWGDGGADAPSALAERGGLLGPLPALRPGPLDLSKTAEVDGRLVADLGNGWTAELTTDVRLQAATERVLRRGRVPMGAVVVLDPRTGEVLAMAERLDPDHEAVPPAAREKGPPHLALRAIAPAASVFKIVTAAALLEAGVSADREFCYHPARRRIRPRHLENPEHGGACADLREGLAQSANGLFARLALEKLERGHLEAAVRRFGFNRVVPFPLLTEASTARVPRSDLERARMAAGFWHSRLTPLHGALIAAAVAGDGRVPAPRLVNRVRSPAGDTFDAPQRPPLAVAMSPCVARSLRAMLRETVEDGTARRAFAKAGDALDGLTVGGKTGTLTEHDPVTLYTWFVGYAPADDPQVAIAVMVGNGPLWWARAVDIARDVLAAWHRGRRDAADPVVARR